MDPKFQRVRQFLRYGADPGIHLHSHLLGLAVHRDRDGDFAGPIRADWKACDLHQLAVPRARNRRNRGRQRDGYREPPACTERAHPVLPLTNTTAARGRGRWFSWPIMADLWAPPIFPARCW